MRILLTGGTGFIGKNLAARLIKDQHQVIVVSRHPDSVQTQMELPVSATSWDLPKLTETLSDCDAIIHLAGESVATGRWTPTRKQQMTESRVGSLQKLNQALAKLQNHKHPQQLLSAGAVGIYGNRADEILTESSTTFSASPSSEQDFLATLCEAWETEALLAPKKDSSFYVSKKGNSSAPMRRLVFRIGIVLGRNGGILQKITPLYRARLGTLLGNGQQWWSWIHVDDLIEMFVFALKHSELSGVVNAVTPYPVRHQEFHGTLARTLGVLAFLIAPRLMLRFLLGDASQMLLSSQRVIPERLQKMGFEFRYPKLQMALEEIFRVDSTLPSMGLMRDQP